MSKKTPRTQNKWNTAAESGDLLGAVLALVSDLEPITFLEVQTQLEPWFEVHGNTAIETLPNAILWEGMSEKLANALTELLREHKIYVHAAVRESYLIDGGLPATPMAQAAPGPKGYAKPQWWPCVLRTTPPTP